MAFSSFELDFDDARLDLHLPLDAVLHGVEVDADAIEPLGKIRHLHEPGFSIDVERARSDSSVCTPLAMSANRSVLVVVVTRA